MEPAQKKPSKRLVLQENNPTMIKVMKLWSLADELGLSISFHGQTTIVEDKDRDSSLPYLRLEDIETLEGPQEWPPSCEFKLVYDNPEYLAQQEREFKGRMAADRAKEKEIEDKRKAKEAEAKAAEAKAKENRERKTLAELRAKYPDG